MNVYAPERRLTSAAVGHVQRLDFTDALYVVGGVAIVLGVALLSVAAALIVAGVLLVAAALVLTFGPSETAA